MTPANQRDSFSGKEEEESGRERRVGEREEACGMEEGREVVVKRCGWIESFDEWKIREVKYKKKVHVGDQIKEENKEEKE